MKHLLEYNSFRFKHNEFDTLSDSEIDDIEDLADELFRDYKIDVVFTNHFKERLRDPRENQNPITFDELEKFFIKMAKNAGKEISDIPLHKKAVIKDIVSKLNSPIAMERDLKNPVIKDMNMVTIMRNPKFKAYSGDKEISL